MPTGIYIRTKPVSIETRQKRSLALRGKKRTLETRERIRRVRLGTHRLETTKRKISEKLKGHLPTKGTTGLKFSIETRKKQSESHKGEKAYQWKGGITPINLKIRNSLEYRLWREAVFKRDNWSCRFCGQRGGKLNADHIKRFSDYPELRFAIDNGRTLCVACHKKTDTFGYKGKGLLDVRP